MSNDESSSVPSVELDDRFNTILQDSQADDEQSIMMAEAVILVDESDNELGYASKVESHHDHGLLHRAFSVLLFNENNELLLQKRADSKVTFPEFGQILVVHTHCTLT